MRGDRFFGRGFGPADSILGLSIALGGVSYADRMYPRGYTERRPHKLEPGECRLRQTGSKRSQRRAAAKAKKGK